jgi:hypothetical protein
MVFADPPYNVRIASMQGRRTYPSLDILDPSFFAGAGQKPAMSACLKGQTWLAGPLNPKSAKSDSP